MAIGSSLYGSTCDSRQKASENIVYLSSVISCPEQPLLQESLRRQNINNDSTGEQEDLHQLKEIDWFSNNINVGCEAVETPINDCLIPRASVPSNNAARLHSFKKLTSVVAGTSSPPSRFSHDLIMTPPSLFKKLNMSYKEMIAYEDLTAVKEDEAWLTSILKMDAADQINKVDAGRLD